ncbi:hypothetical protein JOD62_002868 [Microbacterium keratanolyticum]|nr:hypothetical protein [Microbacterium keratanolyticum]MBM7470320.1 hypothetical protein [Microbacterium keratanolyticum]
MTDDERTAQMELHRRPSGEFGEHHRTEPESTLAFEDEEDGDEGLSLFEFERDGKTYEVTHEGGRSFAVYTGAGMFVTGFRTASDLEDHLSIEDAAREALNVA